MSNELLKLLYLSNYLDKMYTTALPTDSLTRGDQFVVRIREELSLL